MFFRKLLSFFGNNAPVIAFRSVLAARVNGAGPGRGTSGPRRGRSYRHPAWRSCGN
ncbi:hypothetical protein FRACA_1470003 [Frankia canadensis]|uniref:Uncharacterized protein n=1 Tax=Frankia canadensis TaxID=1836972 RepID=A0A2I2KLR5_9ACTN|nr:hypothetical protein FRACA_1470003 [Frankia canadensis]SOU53876.1 hypothetical protein FRACA_1470003 [Frankia canadensis]